MVVERISPNSSSTSQETRTLVKVGFDELEVTIKDQKNRFGSYENVKLKENKFKSHIFHKMEEADIHGTIKDQDKITKKNIIKDIDTMELSVDIFDKPEHAKNEKLLVDEAFILKQSMDPKDFGVCQSNNNVSQHVESNLDILQQSSTTLESHSRCSFEDNGFEIINASSNHYKNLELDGYLNSSIIHQTPTNLFSAIHKYIPINLEENPLSTLKILKRDGSSLLLDCELQTKTNDFKRSPKRGKSSSGAYEFFLGKKKVNDNESTRPTKELKMSEMKIDGTLDIKKIVNGFKHENKLISKSNNIIQLVQEEKEKIITNSFLSNGVSNEVEKNINIFFESRTIQQSKVDNNKIFDLTKQSLETHIGVGPKDNVKIEFELSRLSKKRKKGPHENDALCQEIPQQISHKIVSFQNYHVQLPTHNKPFIDTTIEQQIKRISTRVQQQNKKHTHVEKTYDVEATLAAAIGFPRESLTEEEVEAHVVHTVGGQEQTNYIIVRNHILAKWRENVNVFLQLDTIMKSVRTQHKGLVAPAYKFLLMHGYINFGVASSIKAVKPIETNKASVIIIGAGLAGLGAARQLLAFGHKVLVLEGRQRPGGRVYTKKMEGEGLMASADLGGSVMTGIEGNPLGVLAQQLNLPLHKIRDKCPLYQPNGLPVKEDVDLKVEAQFNGLLDGASKWREDMEQTADSISLGATLETLRQLGGVGRTSEEQQLYDWHLANLEYANAGLLTKLSLAFWDQDDPYEMGGDHCFLPGGNVKLINALAEDIPIKYGKTVHTIKYGNEGVKVFVGEEIYDADMVLCTIPLGVLQRNMLNFEPELPQRKLDAIKRLGFGLLNKVVMLFPKVFWNSELDMFGHLAENPNKRGEYFLFYSYAMVSNEPLLLALVAGEAAIEFEKIPPLQAVMRVMTILRGIYEPQNIEVPNPIQTVCTRWGSDFLSYGSYSNVAVEASGDDYDILAENVGNGRLFFAGEATIRRYPATMHGAYLSGLREAGNIAAATAARQIAPKDEDKIQKDLHLYSSTLEELFKEPDLEFGSFSIIFDHQTSDPKSISIVRLKYEEFKNKKTIGNILSKFEKNNHEFYRLKQPFYLYTTITRQQAYELREVRGGNSERLIYLCQKLEVKLVGRKGLGPHGEALVEAIKWYRATKKSMAIMGPPKSFTMLLQSIP